MPALHSPRSKTSWLMMFIPDCIGLIISPSIMPQTLSALAKNHSWNACGQRMDTSDSVLPCDLSWHRDQHGDSIPAMPHLDELLTQEHFHSLLVKFTEL